MDYEKNKTDNNATARVDGGFPLPSVGDLVFSADGAELGVVEAVLRGTPAQDPALIIIAKGIFLDACRCIPTAVVHSVQDGIVTLDLKARQVEHLPPCKEID